MSYSKVKLSKNHVEWSLFNSSVSQSCRRFLHILRGDDPKGEADFYVQYMCGAGSGTLIRLNNKFFILTAFHVVEEYVGLSESERNTSPFWFPLSDGRGVSNIYDFLYPSKMYFIGDMIGDGDGDGWVDFSDVVMIEICDIIPPFLPNGFIDLSPENFKSKIINKENFFEGQSLNCVGFPFEMNDFKYEVSDEMLEKGVTHSTNLLRHTDVGICLFDQQKVPFVALRRYIVDNKIQGFDDFLSVTRDLNDDFSRDGMSGGVVFNMMEEGVEPLWAGMIVSGSTNFMRRFIPAYVMKDAILNYSNARCLILDYEREAREVEMSNKGYRMDEKDRYKQLEVMEGAMRAFEKLSDEEKRKFVDNFVRYGIKR